jgi:hypothetical protein
MFFGPGFFLYIENAKVHITLITKEQAASDPFAPPSSRKETEAPFAKFRCIQLYLVQDAPARLEAGPPSGVKGD